MQSSDGERTKSSPVGIPQHLPRSGAVKFVGRKQKLEDLHVRLQAGEQLAITAIKGMGGVGKTELALQYAIAQSQVGGYPGGICWLRAREREIATQITAFAQTHLGLTLPELEIDEQVRFCWQRWSVGKVLVVIDDVTDYGEIAPYLPPSDPRFRLLLTTRLNLGRSVETFGIEELDEASALALLEEILKDGRVGEQLDEAKRLCAWVGYLPLGLELLGRYLADDEDLSIQALLEELEETRIEAEALQDVAPGMTANRGVVQALELSWRELSEQAMDLACLLGMFAAAPIPWELVESCFVQIEGKTLRKVRNKELLYRSLLKRVGERQYQLHQIIQEFFRAKLKKQDNEKKEFLQSSFCSALIAVARSLEESLTLAQVNKLRVAIIHIEELGVRWAERLSNEDFLYPFWSVAHFYREQGLYSLAEPRFETCLKKAKNRFGEYHSEVVTSLNNLASIYCSQGRYDEAEALYKEALTQLRVLPKNHYLKVATNSDALASLYHARGRYDEAETLFQEALLIYRALPSNCQSHVATSLGSLAGLYRDKGDYDGAERLSKEALALHRALFDERHPSVAASLNNLADLYRAQGKYDKAEPLLKKALALYRELLGDSHPNVAAILNNLALLHYAKREYSKAEPLYQESLLIRKKLLGDRHPDVATSLTNLADLYSAQGQYLSPEKYEKAESLYKEGLAMRRELLGDCHPEVATSLNNLASLYYKQKKYNKAESMYQDAIALYKASSDNRHPDTPGSFFNLASLYYDRGRYGDAQLLFQEALTLYKALLGNCHLRVAETLTCLARVFYDQEKYSEAAPLLNEALILQKTLLSDSHLEVAKTQWNLGVVVQKLEDYARARILYEEALTIARAALGIRHPYTQSIQGWLNSLPSET